MATPAAVPAWAEWLVGLFGLYVALGIGFALLFHWRGLARVDRSAALSTWGFRIMITPGVVALWPLLALRWARGNGVPKPERNAHRDAGGDANS